MSRSADRSGQSRDRGFTLIEIIVALGILSVVLVALLPQLVVGLRATGTARMISQAKSISSGQLEKMRNLPYHITANAGPFRDVLDYYFPDVVAPGTTPACMTGADYSTPAEGWSGYVASGGARCAYEPATGDFHRVVTVVETAPGIAGYALVVDTQFLSAATPPVPVTAPTDYATDTQGKDHPASSQIGVTVTVVYEQRGAAKPVTTYTQVAERVTTTPRLRAEADVRVLDVGSVTPAAVPLNLSAGILHLKGAVSFASTATADLTAVTASLVTGEQAGGAAASAAAPPTVTKNATTAPAGGLGAGCRYACWGDTTSTTFTAAANDGLPNVGSTIIPAGTTIAGVAPHGVSFVNDPTALYLPGLDLLPLEPLLRLVPATSVAASGSNVCSAGATGTPPPLLSASGYLTTTSPGTSTTVEACAVARATPIELFPTGFARNGVVRVTLERASVRCAVKGPARDPVATYDYEALVEYWNGTGYTSLPSINENAGNVLAAVDLSATSVGKQRRLSDYIESWSSLTAGGVSKTAAPRLARLILPGIVTIASQPVRADPASVMSATVPADPTSVVSATVGALSCLAEDAR